MSKEERKESQEIFCNVIDAGRCGRHTARSYRKASGNNLPVYIGPICDEIKLACDRWLKEH